MTAPRVASGSRTPRTLTSPAAPPSRPSTDAWSYLRQRNENRQRLIITTLLQAHTRRRAGPWDQCCNGSRGECCISGAR